MVSAVVSVTNGADVINDTNVISVNLSYLVDQHNNSCQTKQLATIEADKSTAPVRPDGTGPGLRLGAGWGGMATLFRE
jgi:hypothetical protein